MKLKYDFAVQKVTDFWAAVPVGKDALKCDNVVSLNETARDMFNLLRNDITEDQLVQQMLQEYKGVDETQLRADAQAFIQRLQEADLLLP